MIGWLSVVFTPETALPLMSMASPAIPPSWAESLIISAIANTPMSAAMKSIPSYSARLSNVYRSCGLFGAMPIAVSISPNAPAVRPLMIDPRTTTVISASPRIAITKYSGEPNARTSSMITGERRMRVATEKKPAIAEPEAAIASASTACPFFDIG